MENPFVEREQTIHEDHFNLQGTCIPVNNTVPSKYSNGKFVYWYKNNVKGILEIK